MLAMKKTMQKDRISLPPFQSGQIWQMEGSHLRIGTVGKTLVHYKHFKGEAKRSPISLLGKVLLQRFLSEHKAILVQE
jgi:hypothetical protein